MTATTGIDGTPPISYFFTNNNSSCGANAGAYGTDSGWQLGTSYSDTGLEPNKCYGYTVTARDSLLYTGTASAISSTYTSANVPGTPALGGATGTHLSLTNAENGNPNSNPTTYFAVQVVTTNPSDTFWLNQWVSATGMPSATAVWMTDAQLDALVLTNLNPSTTYGVKVKARNQDLEETVLSAEGQGTTTALTVTMSEASIGQITDQFGSSSPVNDATLFRFRLNATGNEATIDQVVFHLSGVSGIAAGDLSDLQICITGFCGFGGTPAVNITGDTGTITFTTDFSLSTAIDYYLRGDAANLVSGDTLTISMAPSDVTVIDGSVNGTAPSNVTHTSEAAPSATALYRSVGTTGTALARGDGSSGSPTVQATNTSIQNTQTTSHTVALPSGIQPGELLIVIFGYKSGSSNAITWPGGWTQFFQFNQSTTVGAAAAYRKADGSEGATINVTTSLSRDSTHNSYRIAGAQDPAIQPPQSAGVGGNSTAPNPPVLTPTGGAKNYLWIAVETNNQTASQIPITAFPLNYSGGIQANGDIDNSTTGSAYRQLNAASEDPGAFTIGTAIAWAAGTLVVHPASPGAPNGLTISGSTATFDFGLPDNIGVGDVIQYDSDNNGTIDALAFIHGRTSSTVYTVKNKNGADPTATQAKDNDWAIYRAYTSLADWESQTENPNITEPVENDVNPSTDLVTAGTQLNVACYGGGVDQSTAVLIDGWTTGDNNYIKIYTPVSSSEVGVSQRHSGKWDDSKYRLVPNGTGWGVVIGSNVTTPSAGTGYVWIDGLQIHLATPNGDGNSALRINQDTVANHRMSNNILRGPASGTTYMIYGVSLRNGAAGSIARVWNNIIYDFFDNTNTRGPGIISDDADFTSYVYNNTIYSCYTGMNPAAGTFLAKNNIVYNNSNNYSAGTYDPSSTNNLSGPGSDAQMPPAGARNGVTVTFVDPSGSPRDLHLASSDTGAKDYGVDLSSDPNLAISTDIEGQFRFGTWDIGADENVGWWDGGYAYREQITITAPATKMIANGYPIK
jgi:hypothetical protein